MPTYEFAFPSVPESEAAIHEAVEKVLEQHAIDEATARRVLLAISEACTNAMVHGNRMSAERKVKLELTVSESVIRADIIDEGRGGIRRIRRRSPRRPLSEGGRGIDLIRHFADSVEFGQEEDGGLRVSISLATTGTRTVKST
jgi:serine/threonine-protein kinase RsbW